VINSCRRLRRDWAEKEILMIDKMAIESIARTHGFEDFRWISGSDVQVRQWVRFKCMFGCGSFGKKGGCPPAVPSISECRELFTEYEHILVLHIAVKLDDPNDRREWSRKKNLSLLPIEREAFLAGHHQALLLFMDECRLCKECPGTREGCLNPAMARPCPEALGVDVFSTVRNAGFPIEVLTGYGQEMNRYAFLLVE
jgi:predicted metal-binding protein